MSSSDCKKLPGVGCDCGGGCDTTEPALNSSSTTAALG
eukprot:COSAG01_NODE_1738_length_9362_cov_3.455468_1_plen_37_part_10